MAAPVIAALRSNVPPFVVVILFKALVAPTIPSILRIPPFIVKFLAVPVSLFTVSVNQMVPDVVVNAMSALKVTGP